MSLHIVSKLPTGIKKYIIHCLNLPTYRKVQRYWKKRDFEYSAINQSKEARLSDLLIKSHVIEKGLTMPNRRMGFGYDRIRELIPLCNSVIKDYGANSVQVQAVLLDLSEYLQIHEESNFSLPEDILTGIKSLGTYRKKFIGDKSLTFTREEYFKECGGFSEFAASRHSVRSFSSEPIEIDHIIDAVRIAQTAPSACNRQSTRVKIIADKGKIEAIFKIQKGNRGFGHLADKLLYITAEQGAWGLNNRTGAYIDAGIFIMNLLYALHEKKICACTLNAYLTPEGIGEVNDILSLPPSEIPVAFIAIGNAQETFNVPCSKRLPVEEIVTVIE